MVHLLSSEVRQLLHNKFVIILGDSVQRAVYKDLVLLLQKDCLLTTSQLKVKGEENFEKDELVEGGQKLPMHNGTHYREVRQFCSEHHLVRFYFVTRVYSEYLKEILEKLQSDEHTPDVIIMNSCLWDLSRYGQSSMCSYLENLDKLFGHLNHVLPESCLVVWNTAMPVAESISAGFLPPEHQTWSNSLKTKVLEANFYSSLAAGKHLYDVLDLHFHFRHAQQYRQMDGVHWNQRAHRQLTQLLLAHVAEAWGVDLPQRDPVGKWVKRGPIMEKNDQRGKRQPQASSYEPAPLLPPNFFLPGCRPWLPPPPSPSHPPWPPFEPYQQPPPPQMIPPLLFRPPGPYTLPHCPFQPDPFSFDNFHLDAPFSNQSEFESKSDFIFDPCPPMPPPNYNLPVVYRGFPRFHRRGPYTPGKQRSRPFKRKARARPKQTPQ